MARTTIDRLIINAPSPQTNTFAPRSGLATTVGIESLKVVEVAP